MGAFAESFDNVEPIGNQPIAIRPMVSEAADFPIEAMSPRLLGAARAIIDKVQLPAAIAANSVLAAAALGVQPYIDVKLPTGEVVPTSLFLVTVGASGERKSSADKLALLPVRNREAEMYREFLPKQAEYTADNAAYQAARKKAQTGNKTRDQIRNALELCGEEPLAPATPLLLCDEVTMQGLHKLLAEAMPSIGLISDEGAQLLGGYSMQAEQRTATGAGLSKLWDGSPVKRVRAGDGVSILPGRRVSLHLMVQERIARTLFGDVDLANQGLLSRILPCHPTSRKGHRPWREPSEESERALDLYASRLTNLLRSPMPMDPMTRALTPKTISLSAEAKELFVAWHDHVEEELKKGGRFEKISGFAAKLPEHAVRIAAVMAYFEAASVQEISKAALDAGITLAQFYAAEALRLYGVRSADEETDAAASLIEWVRGQKLAIVGARMLGRNGPGRDMNAKERQRAIQLLVEFKHLMPILGGAEVGYKNQKGMEREAYTVMADDGEDGE